MSDVSRRQAETGAAPEPRKALITGASGQDGYYLSRLLIEKGYEVHLQAGRSTAQLPAGSTRHSVDLADPAKLQALCLQVKPNEIYNLAAISRPQESWSRPFETAQINAMLPQNLLETIRLHLPGCKIYQASSSEMFGNASVSPQNEHTAFQPQSPYAIAKVYAHHVVGAYRQHYGVFACAGILFNHDSPRRPLHYVTQKIAHAAALIGLNVRNSEEIDDRGEPFVSNAQVMLGNLDVSRDFGYAGDYVRAMWLMLQHEKPGDYVVGTGETHSIRDICEVAFSHVGRNWQDHVVVDARLVRSSDNRYTKADTEKARRILGWTPSVSFRELIKMMVDARIHLLREKASTASKRSSHA